MSGMRAETINYDGQPAVNRLANMTSVLRHCKASDVRVAQEWLQKSSARVAQGLRKSVRFAATILVLLFIGVGSAWGAENDTHDFTQTLSQLLNNNASIADVEVAEQTYTVKSVVVTVSYNKTAGGATVSVEVGGVTFGSAQTMNSNTTKTFTYNGASAVKGKVVVSSVNNCGSGTGKGTFKITNVRLVEGPAAGPAITTSATSVSDVGYSTDDFSQQVKSFTVSGSSLTANVTVTAPTNYEVCKTSGGTYTSSVSFDKGSGTLSAQTVYIRLQSGKAAGSYSGNVECTSTGATTKNVAVSGSVPFTVTWKANGTTHATTYVTYATGTGTALGSLPDDPDPSDYTCTPKAFYGWYDGASYSHASTAPTCITTATKITSDKTYNAVFATSSGGGGSTTLLSEDFSSITTGNSTATSGSSTEWSVNSNFNSKSYAYQAGGAVKLGSSSNAGYLVTKQLTAAIGDEITIAFKVKGWSSVEGNIQVSGNESEFTQPSAITYTATMSGSFESKSVTVTLTKANPYIKIATTAKRAFIDDIVITKGASVTYSNYETNCCTELGSINGSISLTQLATPDPTKLKASWTMNSTTGMADNGLIVKVYRESDDALVHTSSALAKNTTDYTITGLSPCTSYYATLTTVRANSTYCEGVEDGLSDPCSTTGYTYTVNKTNVSLKGGETEAANSCTDFGAIYVADAGYDLPATITVTNAGAEGTGWFWDDSDGSLMIDKAYVTGNVTVTINGAAQSYFPNNKTIFIQAESSSAWDASACVKAWFNASGAGGSAQATYWLFDATGGDAGKKLFATIVPAEGDLNQVTLQRFSSDCSSHWNDNGTLTKASDGGSNTFRTTGSGNSNVAWNGSGVTLSLHGDPSGDEWASSLATFTDQGAGVWTATYNGYAPANAAGESQEFKIQTNYNGWIGNTGNNDNATLDGMHIGSTYNITATLDVKDHSLVMSKTFVKGTVHFDLQGHGLAIADLTNVTAGSKISAPAAPSATGYDFGGWYKEAGCTNAWNFASDEVTETTTLYAKWTAQTYTITSTLNNVSASPAIPDSYIYTGSAANLSYTISAASGYRLPDNVTVTGSTHTWDKTTGELTLTGTITGAVSISITGVQTHTVTWLSNGSNYVTPVTYDHGATLAFPAGTPSAPASCSSKTFVGWTSDSEITSETSTAPSFVSAGGAVNTDATYRAVFATSAGSGATQWSETALAELTGSDVFVIATPTNYALPNNGGSSKAPDAIIINVSAGKITSSVANELKWNVSGNATDGYVFYPNGSTTTWLYCNTTANSGSNDNIRVGAGTRKFWKLNNGYLVTNDKNTARYLSLYAVTPDFRSYVNTNNGVFVPKFYKYSVDISYTNYITTCSSDPTLNVDPPALDFGNVAVNSSKDMTFTLSGSNLTSNATISVTGAGYSVSPASVSNSGTISSETITVTYQPTVTGDSQTGTVTISSTGADDKTVSLTGNSKAAYTVSLPSPSNGIVTADKTSDIIAGETVTLTITPNDGYQLANISAADGSSNDVTLTGSGTTRTFTMPASDVTVAASFMVRTDYVLVTDISQLADGDIITIATMKGNNAEGYILHDKQNDYRGIKSVTTTEDGKIADSDVEYPILLERIGGGSVWKLYDSKNDGYLYAHKGENYLKTGKWSAYNHEWSIQIMATGDDLHKALIHQQACNSNNDCTAESSDRYIEFNISSDRWSGYLNTEKDGYIYKKELGCDRLPAPTGLNATAVTQTTCTLSWTAVANASGYEVSLDNGSSWTSAGTSTTYNATGLIAGTTYNWKVRATGAGDYCDKGTAAANTVTMKKAVTVTYNDNGATEGQLPVTGGVVNLTEDESYTILGNTGNGGAVLSKDGYTFDGWHSSSTYNAPPAYTIGGTVTVTANITLYANWKPKRDTFIDGVHGTAERYRDGAGYTVPFCSDQPRATSGICEQKHYKFIGWALMGADLTNPANIISAGGSKTATGATYYAVWGEEL